MGNNRESSGRSKARDLVLLVGFSLALHLPFLNQAFHLDDVQYLDIARTVFVDPLFPLDLPYVFEGKRITLWGHPHPPLNSYILAGLLLLTEGEVSETYLHAAYLLFPLLAAVSFYFLARRFTERARLATALFVCIPTLVVTAHNLMADVPLLAFWLSATGFFIYGIDRNDARLLWGSLLPFTAAVFMAYQGLALVPLLALYAFQRRRLTLPLAALIALPAFLLFGWQLLGYFHKGAFYATTLLSYLETFGHFRSGKMLTNGISSLGYLGGVILPFPFILVTLGRRGYGLLAAAGLAIGWWLAQNRLADYTPAQKAFFVLCFAGGFVATLWMLLQWLKGSLMREHDPDGVFLALWYLGVLFYCVSLFIAGSARYLLPAAIPLLLLVVRAHQARLQTSGAWRGFFGALLGCQLALGMVLAHADYRFAETYRQVARDLAQSHFPSRQPFLFSGEWGFRYYLAALGGEIMAEDTAGQPGTLVVKSRLCLSKTFDNELDRSLDLVDRRIYSVASPIRLLDLRTHAGFWSDGWGVLPFWFSWEPMDEIAVYRVGLRTTN